MYDYRLNKLYFLMVILKKYILLNQYINYNKLNYNTLTN